MLYVASLQQLSVSFLNYAGHSMSAIISTQKPSLLVILRREYLEITNGNFCAAKLIEYFKHWTKWKLKTHRTPWIYQPLKNIYADLMGEHSLHVIRSAIAFLEDKKILSKRNNPNNKQDKTYQYQINLSELNELLERRKCNLERSEFNGETHQQISNPQISEPQQQGAAVSEKTMEPDWEKVKEQTLIWEQAQLTGEPPSFEQPPVTHYVDKPNQDNETNGVDLHEDTFSAAASETVEKPTREELREFYQQLRQLPCTPAFRLNSQIQSTVAKYWRNVAGAIAYVKEAIRTWKKVDSPEAVFVKACKEGRKPDNWGKPKVNHPQPTEEQLAQLAEAKSNREILDLYQQPDGLWVVDTGRDVIAWWELIPDAVGN